MDGIREYGIRTSSGLRSWSLDVPVPRSVLPALALDRSLLAWAPLEVLLEWWPSAGLAQGQGQGQAVTGQRCDDIIVFTDMRLSTSYYPSQ